MDKINTILECIKYLETNIESRFVLGGSYGLYVQGIDLNRDFHDIDIKFIDLNDNDEKKLHLDFHPSIHKLKYCPIENPEYKEVDFYGKKILVFSVQDIVSCKKYTLNFIENRAKIKCDARIHSAEKIKADLQYLKETYGIE